MDQSTNDEDFIPLLPRDGEGYGLEERLNSPPPSYHKLHTAKLDDGGGGRGWRKWLVWASLAVFCVGLGVVGGSGSG